MDSDRECVGFLPRDELLEIAHGASEISTMRGISVCITIDSF
jgi:hypothetical protein